MKKIFVLIGLLIGLSACSHLRPSTHQPERLTIVPVHTNHFVPPTIILTYGLGTNVFATFTNPPSSLFFRAVLSTNTGYVLIQDSTNLIKWSLYKTLKGTSPNPLWCNQMPLYLSAAVGTPIRYHSPGPGGSGGKGFPPLGWSILQPITNNMAIEIFTNPYLYTVMGKAVVTNGQIKAYSFTDESPPPSRIYHPQ